MKIDYWNYSREKLLQWFRDYQESIIWNIRFSLECDDNSRQLLSISPRRIFYSGTAIIAFCQHRLGVRSAPRRIKIPNGYNSLINWPELARSPWDKGRQGEHRFRWLNATMWFVSTFFILENDRQKRFESLATIISSWCRSSTRSVSVNHEADATCPALNDKSPLLFLLRRSNSGMFRRVEDAW